MAHIAKTPKGPANKESVPVTKKMLGKGTPTGTVSTKASHLSSPAIKPLPSPSSKQGKGNVATRD